MPPLSRRARLALAAGCLTAVAAGALPVLLTHRGGGSAVHLRAAGSVATGAGTDLAAGDPGTDLSPGDASPIERADPSTSVTTGPPAAIPGLAPSTTTTPASSPTTSTTAVGACAGTALALQAQTDAVSYRPGDSVTVTAVVTNKGTRPCRFDDSHGSGGQGFACPVLVFAGQTAGTPPNAHWVYQLDDASPNPCQPTSVVLDPGDQVSSQAVLPFQPHATCGPSSDPCTLPSGTWTGSFQWAYGTGNPSLAAGFSFTCPPNACTAPPPPSPSSSSSSTTSTSPSTSTSSSTTTTTTR